MRPHRIPEKTVWIVTALMVTGVIVATFVIGKTDERADVMLTTVLAVATLLYAATTYNSLTMADKALRASVRPHLVPSLALVTFTQQFVGKPLLRITNRGPGAAVDVNVSLILEPDASPIRWVGNLASGQARDFLVPDTPRPPGPFVSSISDLLRDFQYLRLDGTCRDALDNDIVIDTKVDIRDQYRHGYGPLVIPSPNEGSGPGL